MCLVRSVEENCKCKGKIAESCKSQKIKGVEESEKKV
jgi:hypothetical protein